MATSASSGARPKQTVSAFAPPKHLSMAQHRGPVLCVDFLVYSDGSERLVTGSEDKTIIVWPLRKNDRSLRLVGHTGPVNAVRCHGKLIVSGSSDKTIRVSCPKKLKNLVTKPHFGPITTLDVCDKWIASGSADKSVKLFSFKNLKFERSFTQHTGAVTCVRFFGNGELLATCGADRRIYVFDVGSGAKLADVLSPRNTIPTCLNFRPDDKDIAVGFSDGKVRIFNVEGNPELLQTYTQLHTDKVTGVEFSPFATHVFVSCSLDGHVAIADALEGSATASLETGRKPYCLALAKTEKDKLAFGSKDGPEVEMWRINITEARKCPARHVPEPVHRGSTEEGEEDVFDTTFAEQKVEQEDQRAARRRSILPSLNRPDKENDSGSTDDSVSRDEYDKLSAENAMLRREVEELRRRLGERGQQQQFRHNY